MDLKILLRSILKEKIKNLLIVSGLTIGFSGFIILQMLINIELGYDTFHHDHSSIYRIITALKSEEGNQSIALSGGGLKDYLSESFPSIKSVTHFIPIYYGVKVVTNTESLVEEKGLYVDENFNDVFDFSIISGESKSMFSNVNTIALTRSLAIKYFGDVNVIGEEMSIDDGFGTRTFKVTGVYNDVVENSSIQFDFLVSRKSYKHWDKFLNRTNKNYFFTYLRFENALSKEDKTYIESNLDDRGGRLNLNSHIKKAHFLQQIQKTHLDTAVEYDISDKTEPKQIYILWFISLSIITITSINFINTNTIQSASKIKILGMTKIFGHKNPFVKILVLDSLLKSLVALFIAVLLVVFFNRSVFEQLFHFKLYLPSKYPIFIWMTICVAVGIIGGLIPAYYLRKKKTVDMVKGKILITHGKYSNLKLTSLIIQLSIVIVLMITTTIIIKQLNYIDDKEVGYSKTDKVLIPAPQGVDNSSYLEFITRAKNLHYIKLVGISLDPFYTKYRPTNIKIGDNSEIEAKVLYNMVNKEFIPAMGIAMKKGKNFSGIYSSDTVSVIINESASKLFIGKEILNTIVSSDIPWYNNKKFRVIGIMKDFHFESFNNSIEPLLYYCIPFEDFAGDITINYENDGLSKLRDDLSKVWKSSGIETPLEMESLENAYTAIYRQQGLLRNVSGSFTILTLFLSLFGLFAYLKNNIEFKTKELAIRRILGATTLHIYYNLNKEILMLFFISIVISIPVGFYICTKWLEQFAYHTTIDFDNFVVPVICTIMIIILIGLYELYAILSKKTTDVLNYE